MFFIGVLIIGATREGKNAIKNTAGLSVWRSCGFILGGFVNAIKICVPDSNRGCVVSASLKTIFSKFDSSLNT